MEDKYVCHASLLQQQQMHQHQQFAERILEHLAFNSDILERWHLIGSAQGLTTDLEVATFLIQHYENTWDRAQPTQFCNSCHSPLSMSCSKCSGISNLSNQHNTFTPLFNHAESGTTTDPISPPPLPVKNKKKKKRKKKKEGSRSVETDSRIGYDDEDLMGLYIQFANAANNRHLYNNEDRSSPSSSSSSALKSYVCMHCGRTVFKLSDFKKHVRTHTHEKPYKCGICPAAFSDSSSAARHKRVHTGEKPFRCDICPSSFAQSSDRTKHMRVHTKERPWQCAVCEKTFSDSSRFAHHRRQHEKQERKLLESLSK